MMRATRILETILYADDLMVAEEFYRRVLGMPVVSHVPGLLVGFRCGEGVLLVFDPVAAQAAGREVPAHGASGAGHVAFAVEAPELAGWREHLGQCGVAIEMEVDWPSGGRSLYFRDPAGNSVELAPPKLWWPESA